MGDDDEQYVVNYDLKVAYGILCLFSMISSFIIPTIYYVSKRTRHHPAGILATICICEMVCSYHLLIWAVDLNNFMEYFKVYEMAQLWTFGGAQNQYNNELLECWSNQTTYFISLYLQFNLYIILCIDLIITLQKPLISSTKRNKFYIPIIIISTIVLICWTLQFIRQYCNKYEELHNNPNTPLSQDQPELRISYPPVLLTEITFYILGIISIVMAIDNRRRTRYVQYPQISDAKDQYVLNHIILVGVIFVLWIVPFINNIYTILNQQNTNPLLNTISFSILLSQGIILGLIRLREDYFRLRLKILIQQYLCKLSDDNQKILDQEENYDEEELDTWNFSLAVIMSKLQNQDLVQSILLGITQITELDDASTVINDSQLFLPNEETLKKWVSQIKKGRFIQDATLNLLILQDSLQKSNLRKSRADKQDQLLKEQNKGFHIQVLEYAPKVFAVLRKVDGIPRDYLQQSLDLAKNKEQIQKAQESMGKSGSFFFFSYDNKFILKTMTETELVVLRDNFLNKYSLHIVNNQYSFIARLYGAFTIRIEGLSPVHLILMENTLGYLEKFGGLDRCYDLKGSLVNRQVKEKEDKRVSKKSTVSMDLTFNKKKKPPVLKDINYLNSVDLFLLFTPKDRDTIIDRLKTDSEFLNSVSIMDYSMLLGVTDSFADVDHQRLFKEQNGKIISISIIDYFQQYDFWKKAEFQYKTLIKKNKEAYLSCIEPNQYLNRFQTFINSIFISLIQY